MRAKADLVPDCDVHGEPMYRADCPASVLGLKGSRDVTIWRCAHGGCSRFFEGAIGYRHMAAERGALTPRCTREGAFLVAQGKLGKYVCPVAGCRSEEAWTRVQSLSRACSVPTVVQS